MPSIKLILHSWMIFCFLILAREEEIFYSHKFEMLFNIRMLFPSYQLIIAVNVQLNDFIILIIPSMCFAFVKWNAVTKNKRNSTSNSLIIKNYFIQ